MPKIDFRNVFTPRNRGILLDAVVFVINLVLMRILTTLSLDFVRRAETDWFAKLGIGLFFAGLLLLQPLGPILKRWSFDQRRKSFDLDKTRCGCLFFLPVLLFYLVMMLLISGTAATLVSETVFAGSGETTGVLGFLGGVGLSVVNTVVIYRYFASPEKSPRWKFLTTPQAELLGDLCMFLNVICLQILWNCVTVSRMFWEVLTSTPLGRAGSFTDILGRFIVIGVLALLVYLPPRIYYLVGDTRRRLTWLTMVLANLPLIIRVAFAAHR